jgi:hypothetical protein
MKLSFPRRRVFGVLFVLLVACTFWKLARQNPRAVSPAEKIVSTNLNHERSRSAESAGAAVALGASADSSQNSHGNSATAPSAALPPMRLWLPLGEVRGAALRVAPAMPMDRSAAGENRGRAVRVEALTPEALAELQPGESVTLPLFGGEEATGRVNLVQADAGHVIRIGGELIAGRPGTFFLSANGSDVDGAVLLSREGVAVMIARDAGGLVMTEKPLAEILCTPMPKPPELATNAAADATETVVALAAIPVLSSRPTATAVIYLDFDGETVTDPRWNGGQTIVAAAPNVSAADVIQAWSSVKEDYWAFNVDVTTDLNRYNGAPVNRRTRCIITPTDTAAPGSGGVSYVNCFSRGGTTTFSATIPCWVFVSGAKPIAEAVAHEVGHTLGLHHDGRTGEEYYAGHGSGAVGWAPVMGVGYYRELVQWSKGEYPNASNTEDDIAIISSATNGFGFVADEAGNSIGTAAALNVSGASINQTGIISQSSDSDFYRVTVGSNSTLAITASPASVSPDLDVLLELQDANGNFLTSANPDTALAASLNVPLNAGTYFLKIAGTGRGSVSGDGYSSYGSIGAYTLSGTITGAQQTPSLSGLTNVSATAGIASAPMSFTVADPDSNVNALTLTGSSSNPGLVPNANISFGGSGASRTVTVQPAANQTGNATITVTVSDGALTSSGSFIVTVNAATSSPVFTLNPASQTVNVGASVSFTASASGAPAPVYQWLKNGAPIAGANSSTFSLGAVSLGDAGTYSVTASNAVGSATSSGATLTVNNGATGDPLLSGVVIGSSPWHGLAAGDKFKAFDGNTSTAFDSQDPFIFVGLDFGAAKTVSRLRYFPRAGFASRMNGARIRGANSADLSDAVTLYTITSTPPEGTWQDVTPATWSAGYRYVFFTTDAGGYGNVAELEFYGRTGTPPASGDPRLSGTIIGSSPWHGFTAGDKFKAFDGDTNTTFDSEDPFIFVGLDFGAVQTITRIRYFPRNGFAYRMNGARIRGANSPDFSDAVTLYTITSAPPEGAWQDVTLAASAGGYRYVFFTTDANGYGNVAELEFFGHAGTPPATGDALLSGGVFGSSPWAGLAVGDKFKAFDGNTGTAFDSEDPFIYVGLDFGAGKTISRLRYFPRAGFAYRISGARIRGANSPDLSDAVTLYTIAFAPPEGTWQDVTLPTPMGAYRYVFFTTDAGGYGNVAELEFYGR